MSDTPAPDDPADEDPAETRRALDAVTEQLDAVAARLEELDAAAAAAAGEQRDRHS